MFNKKSVFSYIAPIYNLFYKSQKRSFKSAVNKSKDLIDITKYNSVIDIGCGTGALADTLREKGLQVTGIDREQIMIDIANDRLGNKADCKQADLIKGLPFDDNTFDVAITSYVAHGFEKEGREILFSEMKRVARKVVILHDFNRTRSLIVTILEILERSDYFNFINTIETEMKDFFGNVSSVQVGPRANWYVSHLN
jgi:ubiquinone/menaquinone biosynthesis C-methylase UbiE